MTSPISVRYSISVALHWTFGKICCERVYRKCQLYEHKMSANVAYACDLDMRDTELESDWNTRCSSQHLHNIGK